MCVYKCVRYLRLVPVLSLCDVLGGDALVLRSDVSQRRRQVRLGHVHLDLHLRLLHLGLQLADLLQEEEEEQEEQEEQEEEEEQEKQEEEQEVRVGK